MTSQAITCKRIFDGETWHERSALLVDDGVVEGIIAANSPTDAERVPAEGEMLVPGFIDLQVNGGGGTLFNNSIGVEAIRTICSTFFRFGTTACLPTLVTDTVENTARAIEAGIEAGRQGVAGFLGLHLEGPHLSPSAQGAHDPALIRPMDDSDLDRLLAARRQLPNLLLTVAPETASPSQIAHLVEGGIVVSIGHSLATYAEVKAAAEAGASVVTHLFNAQSQLGSRQPGVVGAALDLGTLHAGLIADGVHVAAASTAIALRAKQGPGRIFLVTDAMSLTGSDLQSFELNGRVVHRRDGALRLADGTLAGADLTMAGAVANMHRHLGLPLEEALRMASLYPAQALRAGPGYGHLRRGARADMVALGEDLTVQSTFVGGVRVFPG